MSKNKHIGGDFDAFLAGQGELEEATANAVKRVIAWQIEQAMKTTGVNKECLGQAHAHKPDCRGSDARCDRYRADA